MRLHLKHFTLILLLGILIPFISCAQFHLVIPDLPDPPHLVNDLANMMNPGETKALEDKLLAFEQKTSNEIAIVTVVSLGDLEVSEFALELGRKWNIGKASKKNGVLILAAKNEHKINISPGYGLQGALTDALCSRIIREIMVPSFKSAQFYTGFDEGSNAVMKAIEGEFTNDTPLAKPMPPVIPTLLKILFLIIVLFLYFYFRRKSPYTYVSRRGYRRRDSSWGGGWLGGGGWGSSGWGGGSSSGGGGFGGFGGGGG
ncbi:MAG TPA: TPM domain-containing protein, partial [Chitinophagaceae bacterium]|nr:TPM domain-containing protein [Chitinophagaceae bacterium]